MDGWIKIDREKTLFIHGGFVKITIVSLIYTKAVQYLQIVFNFKMLN